MMESLPGPEVIMNGRRYLYFAGTGYFQLHSHPELLNAASRAIMKFGIGSATSRSLTGTTPQIRELESKIAGYFGTEDAAYLPSGYLVNLAGFKALDELGLYDKIFMDEGSHYSNIEGAMATGKPVVMFSCRSVEDLKRKLNRELDQHQKPLIASDGLFPVQAKLAPVASYLELAEKSDGLVWIDDAHGVGILGHHGRGTYEHLGLSSPRLHLGASLSKAFGAYGGMIPGKADFIGHIRSGSVMTGSNSPMNAAVAAGSKGLELVKENPGMREKLWENARTLKAGLESIHIPTDDSHLPIAAFSSGDSGSMNTIQKALMDDGIFIQFTKYQDSGAEGMLRIVVFSTHTRDQIDLLIAALDKHIPGINRQ